MKRALAILLLLITLAGWLQAACGAEAKACCCCGESCACKTQPRESSPGCPCDCGKETKQLEEMPLTIVAWPEAIVPPEVRTPVPPAPCRELAPAERSLSSLPALEHAPPGSPPAERFAKPAPYTGFHRPLRA